MKKLVSLFFAFLMCFVLFACDSSEDDKVAKIRFNNDTGYEMYGVRIDDIKYEPLSAGYTDYEEIDEGEYDLEVKLADGSWDYADSISVPEEGKGTIRFYLVGSTLYYSISNDSKSIVRQVKIEKSNIQKVVLKAEDYIIQ